MDASWIPPTDIPIANWFSIKKNYMLDLFGGENILVEFVSQSFDIPVSDISLDYSRAEINASTD